MCIFVGDMNETIQIRGKLVDLSTPQVMGILNVTPDSFYAGSRVQTENEIVQRCHQIIGAFIMSSWTAMMVYAINHIRT